MALTQTQVSQLYVAIFNRASEGAGNKYWQNDQPDMVTTANVMLDTDDAKDYFGDTLNDNQAFIEWIYKNTLNKTADEDPDGINYWVNELNNGKTKGEVVKALIDAILDYGPDGRSYDPDNTKAIEAYEQFTNRVEVSNYTADHFEGENLPEIMPDYATKLGFENGDLHVTADDATVTQAEQLVDKYVLELGDADVYTLTPDTDIATADIFNAPMTYTPDGSDRILTLQDEDQLTGKGDYAILNAVLGNTNSDEGTTPTVTPTLKNIKEINIDWTGNTNTLDLRYTDSTEVINVNKVTSDAGNVFVNNISTNVDKLKVAHTADPATNVTFNYTKGVLSGDSDSLNLTLDSMLAGNITQSSTVGSAEGFETLNIDASNNVMVNSISINQLENVKITGSDNLEIVSLTPTTLAGGGEPEYDLLGRNSGLVANNSAGIKTIDASEFEGDLTLDISSAMGRNIDPDNSGAPFYGEVKGGKGDDKFYVSQAVTGDDLNDKAHNIIDGGEGDNTLVTTGANPDSNGFSIANDADITNIQRLEIRDQDGDAALGSNITIDFDAFDDKLTEVYMRDEDSGNTTFDLNDVTKDLAENGLVLAHSITGAGSQIVDVELNNATGSDDTVALTIVNDKNQGNQFDYTLTAVGKDTDGIAARQNAEDSIDKDAVENITIHDNDTETNVVNLTNALDHTGTITLDGGMTGNNFTINQTLNAKTIDASGQASNLRLTVGDTTGTITSIDQDVKLGTGDDILTFANIDEFGAGDTITDAGGNDTVRALFSKDSALNLTNIENLHLAATANVTLDMAKADVTNLVLLSDTATNGDSDLDNNGVSEISGGGTNIDINKIITLENTKLTELNFFGDADTEDLTNTDANRDNIDDNKTDLNGNDNVVDHTFNGVTLENNDAEDLTVNINTSLDYVSDDTATYNIGTITTHGNKTMNIIVGNEQPIDTGETSSDTVTNINNIYAKNMETLTATANGDLNLGTVSGNNAEGSLKLVDMTNVKGDVQADVISLGDNAVVKLADGNHDFSALSSSGKDISITSGNGDSLIVGSAQDDTITAGSGDDKLHGDRGDNKIYAGDGNDFVTAKDGNDTIDFGTGYGVYVDNLGTGIDASDATNAISLTSGFVTTIIDVKGDTKITDSKGDVTYSRVYDDDSLKFGDIQNVSNTSDDINQTVAVGQGSDLTISWTGDKINVDRATLDGGKATEVNGTEGTVSGDDNANLAIQTGNGSITFNGAGGNDVYIVAVDDSANGLIFNGGDGNDAVTAGMGADEITGGKGADMIILQNAVSYGSNPDDVFDNVSDTIHIADGESIATEFDIISGFEASAAAGDELDLATANIGANKNYTTAYSNIDSASTDANGLITFNDASGNVLTVGSGADEVSLQDALAFLAQNVGTTNAGDTVLFNYDVDGDGDIDGKDASFVFQDGANDTVVEILHNPADGTGAGVTTISGLAIAATDDMVFIS